MSSIVACPTNVSAITLGDGSHSPVGSPFPLLSDASDADTTTLLYPYTQPHIVSSLPNGSTTISMPPNVTAITINGTPYVPDGSAQNTVTGPDADMTLVVEEGFHLIDELT